MHYRPVSDHVCHSRCAVIKEGPLILYEFKYFYTSMSFPPTWSGGLGVSEHDATNKQNPLKLLKGTSDGRQGCSSSLKAWLSDY